jgi:hypothetical protein
VKTDPTREPRHYDHPVRTGRRPARSASARDHGRAEPTDQSHLPDAELPDRGRGRRPGDLRPLVRHVWAAAGRHRVSRRLADEGCQPFAEVADIVGRTPAACRQLASSARRRIRAAQTPATPTAQQAGIVRDFRQAWEAKDINALIGLLDPDATAVGDGGGVVTATLRPIEGAEQIARFFTDRPRPGRLTIREHTVNGQPGLVAQLDGVTVSVYAFGIQGGRIKRIWAVLNPAKLRPWTAR